MTHTRAWFEGEPCIDELLRDPVTLALMRVDNVTEADLRAAVRDARTRLRAGSEPEFCPA